MQQIKKTPGFYSEVFFYFSFLLSNTIDPHDTIKSMKYPKVFLLSEVFGTDKAFLVDFVLSTTSALGLSIMIKGISGLFNSGLSICDLTSLLFTTVAFAGRVFDSLFT